MADSPKCINCLKAGRPGQTYKISAQPNFHCHDCGTVYPSTSFSPIEFEWKTDQDGWKEFMKSKGVVF